MKRARFPVQRTEDTSVRKESGHGSEGKFENASREQVESEERQKFSSEEKSEGNQCGRLQKNAGLVSAERWHLRSFETAWQYLVVAADSCLSGFVLVLGREQMRHRFVYLWRGMVPVFGERFGADNLSGNDECVDTLD